MVPRNIKEDTFDVTVTVSVSNTFFAWVLGYAGDMMIIGPPKTREEYIDLLRKEIDEAQNATQESKGGQPEQ